MLKSFIFMTKIQIVDASLNCHNKISYIKNLMDAYINIFYQKYSTWICLINLEFSKFFDKLCPAVPDFSLYLSLFICIFLFLCACIYEFYSIKPSHFTETRIHVKLDLINADIEHSYYISISDNQEKNGFCLYQFIYIKTTTWSKYLQFSNLQIKRKCRGNKMIYKQWTWNKKGMKRYNLSKIKINCCNINAWWKELE